MFSYFVVKINIQPHHWFNTVWHAAKQNNVLQKWWANENSLPRAPSWLLTGHTIAILHLPAVLDSPPCWGEDPLVWDHNMLHASRTASQCTVGRGGVTDASKGRWLASAQQWEKFSLATVPQRNKESGAGQHREGEKKNEKEKRPQSSLPESFRYTY